VGTPPLSLVIPMKLSAIPFGTTDWGSVPVTTHKGDTGIATWRTRHFGPSENAIRVRMVDYSPGYSADHWCEKGHILLVLEGEMTTRLKDGRVVHMTAGTSYQVADGAEPHRSETKSGVKLFIVD
jgi:quercetin dioxygenase-like cupin family protein